MKRRQLMLTSQLAYTWKLRTLAAEMRARLIDVCSRTGGHIGAGLGVVELSIALHYVFDTPRDKLIWDVGHQCYPHKILTGRRALMGTMRRRHGLAIQAQERHAQVGRQRLRAAAAREERQLGGLRALQPQDHRAARGLCQRGGEEHQPGELGQVHAHALAQVGAELLLEGGILREELAQRLEGVLAHHAGQHGALGDELAQGLLRRRQRQGRGHG